MLFSRYIHSLTYKHKHHVIKNINSKQSISLLSITHLSFPPTSAPSAWHSSLPFDSPPYSSADWPISLSVVCRRIAPQGTLVSLVEWWRTLSAIDRQFSLVFVAMFCSWWSYSTTLVGSTRSCISSRTPTAPWTTHRSSSHWSLPRDRIWCSSHPPTWPPNRTRFTNCTCLSWFALGWWWRSSWWLRWGRWRCRLISWCRRNRSRCRVGRNRGWCRSATCSWTTGGFWLGGGGWRGRTCAGIMWGWRYLQWRRYQQPCPLQSSTYSAHYQYNPSPHKTASHTHNPP